MRIHAEHRFAASPENVVDALLDPSFVAGLVGLPDVGEVQVVDQGADETERWIAVRLVYDGVLDGIAAKVLGSTAPSWIQTYRFSADNMGGRLEIEPESHGQLLDCAATVTLTGDSSNTLRVLDGHLSVKVPLIGGRAERSLGPAALARMDVEAVLLSHWLARD